MTKVSDVLSSRNGSILTLTLDGPGTRNAIGPDVYRAIRDAIVDAGNDPEVRAIIITGAGGFFSSGGNIHALKDSAKGPLSAVTSNTCLLYTSPSPRDS